MVSTLMFSVNRAVVPFYNGADAWIHFEERGFPDMLVADVYLPELDGFTLALKVKETSPGTTVVLMSDEPRNAPRAEKSRADVFLAKPFDINALFHLVQRFVVDKHP